MWFTTLIVALALGGAFLTRKYNSESYYNFVGSFKLGEGLTLESYNRFVNIAKTQERFETWLHAMQMESRPEADTLRTVFLSREGLSRHITPVYSSLIKSKSGDSGPTLGIRIELASKNPQDAPKALALLGRYMVDVLVYDLYQDGLVAKLNNALIQNEKTENELFQLRLQRPHLQRQQALVEALIEKYARFFEAENTARKHTDMLISTEAALGSSPIVQLMNLQMETAKLDQQLERLERQQKQTGLFLAFYQTALQSYQNLETGEHFFARLPLIVQDVFSAQNMADETVKEAFNTLAIEVQLAQNLWQESQRRLVPPSQSAVPVTRFALVGMVALILGLFASLLLAGIRAWWRQATECRNAPSAQTE